MPAGVNAGDSIIPAGVHIGSSSTHICSQLQVDLEGRSTEHVVIVDLDRCEMECEVECRTDFGPVHQGTQ